MQKQGDVGYGNHRQGYCGLFYAGHDVTEQSPALCGYGNFLVQKYATWLFPLGSTRLPPFRWADGTMLDAVQQHDSNRIGDIQREAWGSAQRRPNGMEYPMVGVWYKRPHAAGMLGMSTQWCNYQCTMAQWCLKLSAQWWCNAWQKCPITAQCLNWAPNGWRRNASN